MIINRRMILQAWTYYNGLYFNNELPSRPHTINIAAWHDVYGTFAADASGWLTLGINKRLTPARFRGTMIHEMIHCWQWWNEFPDEHGYSFWGFLDVLENKGVDIKYVGVLD